MSQLSLEEAILTRPAMFLGSTGMQGILTLFYSIASDTANSNPTQDVDFSLTIHKQCFELTINSKHLNDVLVSLRDTDRLPVKHPHLLMLGILSSEFDLLIPNTGIRFSKTELRNISLNDLPAINSLHIRFSLNNSVFRRPIVDYFLLHKEFMMVAILNRNIQIHLKDNSGDGFNQNTFHFPQGIKYLLDNEGAKLSEDFLIKLYHEQVIQGNSYSMAIGFTEKWQYRPLVLSFANESESTSGGSHVNGIVAGVTSAIRRYLKEKPHSGSTVSKKIISKGLNCVCSVKGEVTYYGATKERVDDKTIFRHFKKIAENEFYRYLASHPESASAFIKRFED